MDDEEGKGRCENAEVVAGYMKGVGTYRVVQTRPVGAERRVDEPLDVLLDGGLREPLLEALPELGRGLLAEGGEAGQCRVLLHELDQSFARVCRQSRGARR